MHQYTSIPLLYNVMQQCRDISHSNLYINIFTHRDVQLLGSGRSSFVHLAPECRCPPSHPVVDSSNTVRCVQHTGHSTDRGTVRRINQQATPPGYINNQFSGDQWISEINEPNTTISVKLSYTNFNFEVSVFCTHNSLIRTFFTFLGIFCTIIFWKSSP